MRPRGPLVFRVAERMSLISDALYLEATRAPSTRMPATSDGAGCRSFRGRRTGTRSAQPSRRARSHSGSMPAADSAGGQTGRESARFPGLGWLRQPDDYSDREWILEIAEQYRL